MLETFWSGYFWIDFIEHNVSDDEYAFWSEYGVQKCTNYEMLFKNSLSAWQWWPVEGDINVPVWKDKLKNEFSLED